MSVICPVTNKECPYLKKLDSDVCPREHTCDAVKESYSDMVQRPPAPKKFLIILFSILLIAVIAVCIIYFVVFDGDLSSLGSGKKPTDPAPPEATMTAVPTEESTKQPTTPVPTLSASHTPLPVTTPVPEVLPPVPVTSEAAKMPVRIIIEGIVSEVKAVSLDENQNIDVLPTAMIISWYEGSYIPGFTGNSIMFGYKHFDGMAGVFYNLDNMKKGDKITFTLDNGATVIQVISKITVYKNGILTEDVLELENTNARTVLISETGDIDPATGSYKDLIVIIAE